jgi:calcineurin-like phosphoesterase family protein
MKIFVTSDTHFGHNNIIKYCNRPFKTSQEMDETLIKNYNSVVSNDDHVYFLGDFSMSNDPEYLNYIFHRLHGRKFLIKRKSRR